MPLILFCSVANAGAIAGFLILCAKKKQNEQKTKAGRVEPLSQSVKSNLSKQSDSLKGQNESIVKVKTTIEKKSERQSIGANKVEQQENKSERQPFSENNVDQEENKTEIKELSVSQRIGKPSNEDERLKTEKSCISQTIKPASAYVLKVGERNPGGESVVGKNKVQQEAVEVRPRELRFTGEGGESTLNFENKSGNRLAIKMKCSDNALFRLNPVYMFIERNGKGTVDVSRLYADPKPDKLEVVYAEAADDVTDVQAVFKDAAGTKKLSVPVYVI